MKQGEEKEVAARSPYWRRWVSYAFSATRDWFAPSPQKLVTALLYMLGSILYAYFRGAQAMLDEWLVQGCLIVAPLGAFGAALFLWNLARAPQEIEKKTLADFVVEIDELKAMAFEPVPAAEIVYEDKALFHSTRTDIDSQTRIRSKVLVCFIGVKNIHPTKTLKNPRVIVESVYDGNQYQDINKLLVNSRGEATFDIYPGEMMLFPLAEIDADVTPPFFLDRNRAFEEQKLGWSELDSPYLFQDEKVFNHDGVQIAAHIKICTEVSEYLTPIEHVIIIAVLSDDQVRVEKKFKIFPLPGEKLSLKEVNERVPSL